MRQPTVHSRDQRPAANQYSLRGMFLFMSATCVILALLAWVIRSPVQWLGVLMVPLCSFLIIAALELAGRISPPRLNEHYSYPPAPENELQTVYFNDKENPFGIAAKAIDSPVRRAITRGIYGKIETTAATQSESQDPVVD